MPKPRQSYPVCVGGCPRDRLDLREDGREDICGIIGHLVLEDAGDAFHAHASVHVLGRQGLKAGVLLPIELQGVR